MLFTNKTLEIFIDEEGRKHLELYNLYGDETLLPIYKKINDKILFVQDNITHKYLTLNTRTEDISLENKKDDTVYLILDLLDYKHFRTSSKIESVKGDRNVEFKLIKELRFKNRFKSHWTISILELQGNGFGILKLTTTSGRISYIIADNNKITNTTFRGAAKYIADNNIDFKLEKAMWTIER